MEKVRRKMVVSELKKMLKRKLMENKARIVKRKRTHMTMRTTKMAKERAIKATTWLISLSKLMMVL